MHSSLTALKDKLIACARACTEKCPGPAAAICEFSRKNAKLVAALLVVLGALMIWGGCHNYSKAAALTAKQELRAEGLVTALRKGRTPEGVQALFPVVAFRDHKNRLITFLGPVDSSLKTGKKVTVLFSTTSPKNTAIVSPGVMGKVAAFALAVLGGLLVALGLRRWLAR